jgi:hypothetical protein
MQACLPSCSTDIETGLGNERGGSMHRHLRITLVAFTFVALTLVSAHAQTIPAEDDAWVTGSGTQIDFSNFGTVNITQMLGSQPVNSVVSFTGVPINQSALGSADTLISRGATTAASQFTAPLSIKGLSLGSSPNMTLQDGRVYHVAVSLATQSDTGTMNFTTTTSEGGTFSSSFTVTPILTFTNVNNPNEAPHTVNCANAGCSFPMNGSGNWVKTTTSGTGFDPQSMGIPIVPQGVQVGGYTTTGKGRSGGIQVGCGGTKAAGYGCGQNNELHGQGSLGQAIHGTKPPNDCSSSPPPPPAPSPTPIPTGGCATTFGGGGGCTATRGTAVQKQTTGQAVVLQTEQLCATTVSAQ